MIYGGIRMIQKYVFGTPFETEAVVKDIPAVNGDPAYGCISTENGFRYTCLLYTSRCV